MVAGSRVIQHPEEAMSSLAEVTLGLPLKALARQEDKTGFRELEQGKCVHHCPGGEGTNNPLNLRRWPSAVSSSGSVAPVSQAGGEDRWVTGTESP